MTKLGWPSLGEPGGVAVAAERSADDAVGVPGRAAELARIGRFLDEVASHPAALLIEGEPGIGKTTLWEAAIALETSTLFGSFRIDPVTGAQMEHRTVLVRWTGGKPAPVGTPR